MQLSQMSKADKIVNFLIKQIRENRTRLFTIIGFTLGIILLTGFVFIRLQTLNETASDRLAAAYMSLARGDQQQAKGHLNNAIAYSRNAPASYQARMVKADMLIEEKDYANALTLLKETEEKGNPELMRPLALSRIIYLYDQQKDYANAILYSNEFISKYEENFLIKNIYLDLARYYIFTQSPEEAKRVYGEIMTRFPATAEAEYAEKFLQGLQ
ncbi:MAG: hypothetical protein LBL00_08490 [Endomicrobium sp.]|jgi:tetratricopeptide (TPR) repeat protein|nr:hypothetical protein [Endomicrobium sp.]